MIPEQHLRETLITLAEFSKHQFESLAEIRGELSALREAVLAVNPKLGKALERSPEDLARTIIRDVRVAEVEDLIQRLIAETIQ